MIEEDRFENYKIERVNYSKIGEQMISCPVCTPTRKKKKLKDLSVNVGLGVWCCHHCGWKGGLKKSNSPKKEDVIVIPTNRSHTNLGDAELNWFRGRGISVTTLERNKISKANEWMPQTQRETNVICFNYYRGDKLVNTKFRSGAKGFKQVKGADKILYKLNDLKDDDWCIITEGEMDALSFEEAGFKNAVSVPDGAPNPNASNLETKFSYFENCAEDLERMKKIYIATDNDEAGVFLKEEIARRLGKHICYVVEYPKGCKDANDVINNLSLDALKKCVDEAKMYPIEDIVLVSDFSNDIDVLYNKGYDSGVTVGFDYSHSENVKPFDSLISFKTSMLTVVTGIPNQGKSNFVEYLSMRLNVFNKWKVGLFSPEHYPMEVMFQRLAKLYIGKQFFNSKKYVRMDVEQLEQAKKYLNDNYFFIRPKNDNFSLDVVLESAKGLVLRYGIKLLKIDPWNTITHQRSGMSETDYTEFALNKINDFKQRYAVHVMIIAHPSKMSKDESNTWKVPNMYSISGSAHWFNKTDNGIVVYRDYDRDEVQVYIQKVKYEHLGQQGMAVFKWNKENSRYFPKGLEPDNNICGIKIGGSNPIENIRLPYKDNDDDDKLPFSVKESDETNLPF